MAIELAQKIEDNQKIHLRSILLVFVFALVMAPAPQIVATSFAVQIQDPNEQLIDKLTANLSKQSKIINNHKDPDLNPILISLSNFLIKDNKIVAHLIINNNVSNQRSNHANINFFGKNLLVKATGKSTSQPKKNSFYAFNLTDDNHNMNELAKINFVLDSNKAFTSTANNNKPPKTKVFKNFSKLESLKIVQKSGLYSVVKDLIKTPTLKTNKHSCQAELTDNSNIIFLICKTQMAGYFIDLILNSESFPMINVYGNKKKDLGIAKTVSVWINSISIKTDIEVSKTKEYTIIVGNKWLKKTKVLLDYKLYKLIIRYDKNLIVVKYYYWTTLSVPKQNQEKKQLDESDNNESDKEKDQKEQEKTAEFIYTIFTNNNKSLDKIKADKKEIIVNGKLIYCSTIMFSEKLLIENLAKKPNTVISSMVLMSSANTINLCILLVMNISSA
ncbi:hypothetical protein G9A89_007498 [Geosiphon pyriformis]|nr:hypothetical protein G9A89_007498 [Geosiphon pyriformis]